MRHIDAIIFFGKFMRSVWVRWIEEGIRFNNVLHMQARDAISGEAAHNWDSPARMSYFPTSHFFRIYDG